MDDHIRKLDAKIQSKESELNALFTKIQKIGERNCNIIPQEINLQNTGIS